MTTHMEYQTEKIMQGQTYNGWKNYQTWNVALWIGNDEGLYQYAKALHTHSHPYEAFVDLMIDICEGDVIAYRTPDDVAWNDSGLDIEALDEMIKDL